MEDEQEAPGLGLSARDCPALTFRLLAVDLDGTLVDRRGRVHPQDREAIVSLAKRGIRTTILTGRLYSGTKAVAAEIGVAGPVGCVDGCHLVDVTSGLDLHHRGLTGVEASVVRELLAEHGPATFLFAGDRIVHDGRGVDWLRYVQGWSFESASTPDVLEHESWQGGPGPTAIVALGAEGTIRNIQRAIEGRLSGLVQMDSFPFGSSGLWGSMIRAAGYSKGTALAWVASHHGLSPSDVVVVGDWFNDVPMFQVAGRSFAMAQAPDDVKKAATDCLEADSKTGGGIVEAATRCGLL